PSRSSARPEPATPALCPRSLHDALPICRRRGEGAHVARHEALRNQEQERGKVERRRRVHGLKDVIGKLRLRGRRARGHKPARPRSESTRLNSSHVKISYAVFCLKKKTTR